MTGTDMTDTPPRAEHQLLLALATPTMSPSDVERCRELLSGRIDWGVLLDTACRQYVVPLVARNLSREGLLDDGQAADRLVPNPHALLLEHAYLANRRRNEALRDEVETITWHARRAGLELLLRKGLALGVRLYGDHGVRTSSDIDFLVRRADGRRAVDMFTELGYVAGVADRQGRAVDRWSSEGERLMYLSVPNLPQLVRTTGTLELPAASVGLTTGLFERNTKLRYDVEGIFERQRTVTIGSATLPTMHPVDTLVDLCAHFFKDAKSLFSIEYGKDLTLLKLVDIRLCLEEVSDDGLLSRFEAMIADNGLAAATWFTLSYVDAAFPGAVPARLLADWRPDDPLYLHRYGDNEGQEAVWPDRDLLARLFDHTRAERKEGSSRFWGLTEGTADQLAVGATPSAGAGK
jgi:Uncharacterised nucleotidyltransferase